jgi:GT2 family glycosyltransferase
VWSSAAENGELAVNGVATGSSTVSVVIPTYGRLEDLRRVLDGVHAQHVPAGTRLEVVVVDDGSPDETWEWLDRRWRRDPERIALRQANAGPARARNRGVDAASGELILFLGDDTEPQPGWLLEHVETHRLFGSQGPLAVVGYTSFPGDVDSPFLRFINEFGAQFGYLLIDAPEHVPFNFFYTSNVSLPRRALVDRGGFREDFPAAAWEDIEFAYRACADGLRLRYRPRARTVHRHRIDPRTFCRRQRTSGHSAAIFGQLHPELQDFLGVHLVRRGAVTARWQQLLAGVAVAIGERFPGAVPARIRRAFLDACYHQGLAEGLQSR